MLCILCQFAYYSHSKFFIPWNIFDYTYVYVRVCGIHLNTRTYVYVWNTFEYTYVCVRNTFEYMYIYFVCVCVCIFAVCM